MGMVEVHEQNESSRISLLREGEMREIRNHLHFSKIWRDLTGYGRNSIPTFQ